MTPEIKIAVENTVNRATNMLLTVVRAYEDHGKDISDANSAKIFAHLRAALASMMERAIAARSIQRNSVGAFSFDAAQAPEPPAQIERGANLVQVASAALEAAFLAPPTLMVVPQAVEKPKWVKPEGRLAGTKEPIYATTPASKAGAAELNATPDNTGFVKDAGFLDK